MRKCTEKENSEFCHDSGHRLSHMITTRNIRGKWKWRCSSVSIVTRIRAGRMEFETRQWQGCFLFATAYTPPLEPPQLPIKWVTEAPSLGVKWVEREAYHS
jgi:hypothetical protein